MINSLPEDNNYSQMVVASEFDVLTEESASAGGDGLLADFQFALDEAVQDLLEVVEEHVAPFLVLVLRVLLLLDVGLPLLEPQPPVLDVFGGLLLQVGQTDVPRFAAPF
jgi:hypothetical protein